MYTRTDSDRQTCHLFVDGKSVVSVLNLQALSESASRRGVHNRAFEFTLWCCRCRRSIPACMCLCMYVCMYMYTYAHNYITYMCPTFFLVRACVYSCLFANISGRCRCIMQAQSRSRICQPSRGSYTHRNTHRQTETPSHSTKYIHTYTHTDSIPV
jgi:hypothetical protein